MHVYDLVREGKMTGVWQVDESFCSHALSFFLSRSCCAWLYESGIRSRGGGRKGILNMHVNGRMDGWAVISGLPLMDRENQGT